MALDEATTGFLVEMGEQAGEPIHERTPEQAREFGPILKALYGEGPQVVRAERAETAGGVPVRVLVPTERPRGLLVYYHGGGWVMSDIDEFEVLGRELATRSGFAVVLVNYRKAPEHPYPTAVLDAWEGLRWAESQRERLAGNGAPLLVAGDSAGGNLAAVVARQARDADGPEISMQVLVYPVTDCDLDADSYHEPANQLMIERRTMMWFWDHYLPDPSARTQPDAAPLRAQDLSRLPPALVLLAEHDVLRDEGAAYAEKLREAGVPVQERLFEGQMHGFFQMINVLPASRLAVDHVAETINEQLDQGK